MRRIIASALASLALVFVGVLPANAHDGHHSVDPWQAHDTDDGTGDPYPGAWVPGLNVPSENSEITGAHSVFLSWPEDGPNLGTSVGTPDLALDVPDDAELTFEHELFDDAKCEGGAPRVFVVINGTNTNTWDDGTQCDGSVTIDDGGTITSAGVVYDNGNPGSVQVWDLVIDDNLISFLPPPVDVEPEEPATTGEKCDGTPATLTIPDVEGVSYTIEHDGTTEDVEPGASDVTPGTYVVTAQADKGYVLDEPAEWALTIVETVCETDEGKTDNENIDDESTATLPDTGVGPLALVGVALLLIVVGAGMLLGARQRRVAKYSLR